MRFGLAVCIGSLFVFTAPAFAKPPGILGMWKLEIVNERYCTGSDCYQEGEIRRFKITRYWSDGYHYKASFRTGDGEFQRFDIRPKKKSWVGESHYTGPCTLGGSWTGNTKFVFRAVQGYMILYRDAVAVGCGETDRWGDTLKGNRVK